MHLQSIGSSWDLTPAQKTTVADLDLVKVADYIRKANETGRRNIAADESPQTVLEKIGLILDSKPTWGRDPPLRERSAAGPVSSNHSLRTFRS
jgi:predicted HTH transcriptional regulator